MSFTTVCGHELGVLICRSALGFSENIPGFFSSETLIWFAFVMAGIWFPTALVVFAHCKMSRSMPFGKDEYWGFCISTFVFLFSIGIFATTDFEISYRMNIVTTLFSLLASVPFLLYFKAQSEA